MNTTSRLVEHALGLDLARIPPAAIAAAKVFLVDTLGVGVAGARAAITQPVRCAARQWGEAGSSRARLWGTGETVPAASAAFVNAFQIHCQEFDCVHEPAVVHPMAVIGGAIMAEVERSGRVTGRALIEALTAGVDTAASLGVAARSALRFFRPANAGAFGATLAIARLRGFSTETTLDALGIMLGLTSGTMQAHVEGKPVLPFQIAAAARSALTACDAAEAGLAGPHDVMDGPFGYFRLFETESDPAPILAALGKTWRFTEVSHKPFPTGRAAQGGIKAVQALLRQGVTAQNLARLELTAPPLIYRLVGRRPQLQMSANYARLCFAYCGAVALVHGHVGLSHFDESALSDRAVVEIAERIHVIDDMGLDPSAFTPQTAVATLSDGSQRHAVIAHLPGSPEDRLSEDAHLEKFRACMAFGMPGADAGTKAAQLLALVNDLENLSDGSRLIDCLVP